MARSKQPRLLADESNPYIETREPRDSIPRSEWRVRAELVCDNRVLTVVETALPMADSYLVSNLSHAGRALALWLDEQAVKYLRRTAKSRTGKR